MTVSYSLSGVQKFDELNSNAFLHFQLLKYAADFEELYSHQAELKINLQQLENANELLAGADVELSTLAYKDVLTGLPNRRLVEDRAKQAIAVAQREGSGLSCMYLDLDRFKPVNDTLGHEIGDIVLKCTSERMRKAMREGDTVARVGGDEFVILIVGTISQGDLNKIAQKVIDAISMPLVVGDYELIIGASIGCARYPQDGDDMFTLLKHADIAMYSSKKSGGNSFNLFDPEMCKDHRLENITLGTELWHAIERQELHLVFQPQVTSGGNNTLLGCEALLRWNHPVFGDISPSTFIPIAEKNGAIVPIGSWVINSACEQLKDWHDNGLPGLTMSVNVSPRQLRKENFEATLASILKSTGIPPETLELEVTESEIMLHHENDESCLISLRKLGVKIAIDDFGTGYSSLSRLKHLPIDRLKIDQSFVRGLESDPDSQAISSCIVGMGVAMSLEVIAEGVESLAQLEQLGAQGCHMIQGFLIGRPMPSDVFLHWALERDCNKSAEN
ncbi:MAG: EAL domain-containing protein [Betaproteobacteria bacterium]